MHQPHGRKFPPGKWDRLVSPQRHEFLQPEQLLRELGVASGMAVADLGAGPGFFTLPLAELVGAGGTVYATDISTEMLDALRGRGLPPQVRTLLAEEGQVPIADAAVDFALLAFVLHELVDPVPFLRDVARTLRPGASLVVLEWKPIDDVMGPPRDERISAAHADALLHEAGFDVHESRALNDSQYLLRATPRG